MLPDQVSNPGPMTYESGALLALCSPASICKHILCDDGSASCSGKMHRCSEHGLSDCVLPDSSLSCIPCNIEYMG